MAHQGVHRKKSWNLFYQQSLIVLDQWGTLIYPQTDTRYGLRVRLVLGPDIHKQPI